MARFHASVIEPLTDHDTERRRIQRGLYCLQIFCNVCGWQYDGDGAVVGGRMFVLRHCFPAHQVEEMLCVNEFMKAQYVSMFQQDELIGIDDPRDQTVDGNPPIALIFLMYQGPVLLSKVCKSRRDNEKLVKALREGIIAGLGDPSTRIRSTLSTVWRTVCYADMNRWEKTPFVTDSIDSPPLAWVLMWKSEASNSYEKLDFRRWGYIMWDGRRIEKYGFESLLEEIKQKELRRRISAAT
ncbi:hypothetical protein B0H63DRAFT_540607 [Podospora didyma]|uniref:Uncharacterized protein n=1 Tax=Podospora didyma TaxID=330526 RepID=A0AAE0U124_9PEZI|nr:hypothetical protein B0H63DRAFT_540607 [Podospora didyma]